MHSVGVADGVGLNGGAGVSGNERDGVHGNAGGDCDGEVCAHERARDARPSSSLSAFKSDIFSMAIARASDPKARNDTSGENTSYQRVRKQAQDVMAGIGKHGSIIAPDEATPEMIAKGVSETAENKTSASEQTGGNADYIASIYNNMVAARNEKSSD